MSKYALKGQWQIKYSKKYIKSQKKCTNRNDNRHIHVCFFENEPQRFHHKTGTIRYRHGKIRQDALDTFKAEIIKHFMQPAEGVRRVRKLLTDRTQAVVSQPYTAYSFTLKRLVKSVYGKIPYEGKIGYESENMRHCRETLSVSFCISQRGHPVRATEFKEVK